MPAIAFATIQGLSRASGIEPETIRLYLDKGLLPAPRRRVGRSGNVAYHQEHLDRLRFISRALALGFSLDSVGELLGANGTRPTCADVYRIGCRRVESLKANGDASADLEHLLSTCRRSGTAFDCSLVAELARAD
jgi:MerR family mercuric resistance operon transcriptional regulator